VQRDIPANQIEAGVKKSNLRELVEQRAKKLGIKIKDIRYREIGHVLERNERFDSDNVSIKRMDYDASGGKEIFLSFEDTKNDVLIAFLRLRIPFKPFRQEITDGTALVRELHVYGPLVPVGQHKVEAFQHKGFGKKLLEKAENIAGEEFDAKKILVISGVGVRGYYRKLGYMQDGPYVSKVLK
jgi:elongator complex protein 3